MEKNATNSYSTMLYDEYVTQLLGDYHDRKSKDPLFLYMAFQTIHAPIESPPRNYSECTNVTEPNRQIYCNQMQYLDEVILHYVDLFKQYKLWDDTLLIFSTDNGGMPYVNANANQNVKAWGCNMPYRAGKGTLFEGGVKGVGFINGGDNVIPSKLRGSSSDILSHVIDWSPTIVQGVVGETLPIDIAFDGISMWNTLMNPKGDSKWERSTLFIDIENNGSYAGLIDGDYKYFQGKQLFTGYFPCGTTDIPKVDTTEEWLFDLKNDPYESKNIASEHQDLVKKYKLMIEEFVVNGGYVAEQNNRLHPLALPIHHHGVWRPWLDSM